MMGATQSANSTFSSTPIDSSLSSSLSTFEWSANSISCGQQPMILADTALILDT